MLMRKLCTHSNSQNFCLYLLQLGFLSMGVIGVLGGICFGLISGFAGIMHSPSTLDKGQFDPMISVLSKVILAESVATLIILYVSLNQVKKVYGPYVGLEIRSRTVQSQGYYRHRYRTFYRTAYTFHVGGLTEQQNCPTDVNSPLQSIEEQNRQLQQQLIRQQQQMQQLQQQQQQQSHQVSPAPPRSGYEPDGYETLPNVPAPSYDQATNA